MDGQVIPLGIYSSFEVGTETDKVTELVTRARQPIPNFYFY